MITSFLMHGFSLLKTGDVEVLVVPISLIESDFCDTAYKWLCFGYFLPWDLQTDISSKFLKDPRMTN